MKSTVTLFTCFTFSWKTGSEYLVTHEAVLEDDLKMLGKGYKQPIATNKTEVGRKMNRRIDIIVKPDSI